MIQPILSICIPTYNRKIFLQDTLDRISLQEGFNESDIEIIISDNASTDLTGELVKSYQEKYSNIKYYRNEDNIGGDRNVLSVVQKGGGKYLWCLSDDDVILPGGLKIVLDVLRQVEDSDIWFFQTNFSGLNIDLSIFKESFMGSNLKTTVFKNVDELYMSYSYFHFGLTFLSTHIFSSQILDLELSKIPITHVPHACIAGLISRHKAMFISTDIVGYRPYNAIDNIDNFGKFFNIFVIGQFRYMRFLRLNNSIISQWKLARILVKMFLYSFYICYKSFYGRFVK